MRYLVCRSGPLTNAVLTGEKLPRVIPPVAAPPKQPIVISIPCPSHPACALRVEITLVVWGGLLLGDRLLPVHGVILS